jgi:hypothetical protein
MSTEIADRLLQTQEQLQRMETEEMESGATAPEITVNTDDVFKIIPGSTIRVCTGSTYTNFTCGTFTPSGSEPTGVSTGHSHPNNGSIVVEEGGVLTVEALGL